MTIKKDETGRRWVEMEFVAPGTPEQLWRAMATGPGYTAWFTPATIEEQVGGKIVFDFGGMGESKAEVTAWEPPYRFGYVEREWAEDAPPLATEITIAARSGGQCVVRMVHSLFASTDDWDDQMEGFEKGWPGFFEVLQIYLAHFAGQEAAIVAANGMTNGEQREVWRRLTTTLDLAGADVGEQRTAAGGPEPLSGIVSRVHQDEQQRYLVLRLTAPTGGVWLLGTFGFGGQVNASMGLYLYGDDADRRAAESTPKWQEWFAKEFGPGATSC